MRATLLALLIQLALVPVAFAVTFDDPPTRPTFPVADEPVTARLIVSIACAHPTFTVVRTGNVVELRHQGPETDCSVTPYPTPVNVALGTFAAGVYDLRLVDANAADPRLDDQAILTVNPSFCTDPSAWPPGGPDAGAPLLCLHGGKFAVTAEWTAHDGTRGFGSPLPLTRDSGSFWFFDEQNLELMVKVLDACALNGKRWVFASGLTDVRVVLRVHEVATGLERSYERPRGTLFAPIADATAFACAVP